MRVVAVIAVILAVVPWACFANQDCATICTNVATDAAQKCPAFQANAAVLPNPANNKPAAEVDKLKALSAAKKTELCATFVHYAKKYKTEDSCKKECAVVFYINQFASPPEAPLTEEEAEKLAKEIFAKEGGASSAAAPAAKPPLKRANTALLQLQVRSKMHVAHYAQVQYFDLPGYVYIWSFDQTPNDFKVGMTTVNVNARVRASISVRYMNVLAWSYTIHDSCQVTSNGAASAYRVEQEAHRRLDAYHVDPDDVSAAYGALLRSGRTEFFVGATLVQVRAAITAAAAHLGATGTC